MTAALLDFQKQIRRAVQLPLYTAVQAAGILLPNGDPAIQWGAQPFDRTGLTRYFVAQVGMGTPTVLEVGPRPMFKGVGFLTVAATSELDLGEDGNDVLTGIVASAYPYASTPSYGGVSVFIDTAQHRGYGSDGPYMTGLITVNWNIYQRP